MIDIEGILSHEIGEDMTITEKQLVYLFTKFLLATRTYKEFVSEYVKYHKSNLRAKDVISESVKRLILDNRPINDMVTAYCSAFDWWGTEKGSLYWSALSQMWYDMTKKHLLYYIYVK